LTQRIFCWISSFRWLVKLFWYSIFCWVITMYLCWLIKFCWHCIFCWISWCLPIQQIFAYSAIFCCVIIRHFDNSASSCWHSIIFCWIRSFHWLVKFLLI